MSIKSIIKSLLRDNNQASYIEWEGRWLSHHDVCHMELSKLNSITICGHQVTGIRGVCIPEFGTEDNVPQYDGLLDECRVAFYQLLKYPSLCGIVRAGYWIGWLMKKGENPLRVLYHQWKSM